MNYENYDLDFKCHDDIDMDDETRSGLAIIIQRLQFSAPSDSGVRVALRRSAGKIMATCHIVSQAGEFVAEAISDHPIRAVREMEHLIGQQLKNWKSHRFDVGHFNSPSTAATV